MMYTSSKNAKALKAGTNITLSDDTAHDVVTVHLGTVTKSTVGLSNVDNTADSAKVVSAPQLIALNQREYVITTTVPLRKDQSILNNTTALSIEPVEDIEINNLTANGFVTITRKLIGGKWHTHCSGS